MGALLDFPSENMQGCFMYSKFMEEFDAADYVGKSVMLISN